MNHHINIIDGIRNQCIELNKGIVSDEDISLITSKYKTLYTEIDEAYRCIGSLNIDDNLIGKTRIHIQKTLCLSR